MFQNAWLYNRTKTISSVKKIVYLKVGLFIICQSSDMVFANFLLSGTEYKMSKFMSNGRLSSLLLHLFWQKLLILPDTSTVHQNYCWLICLRLLYSIRCRREKHGIMDDILSVQHFTVFLSVKESGKQNNWKIYNWATLFKSPFSPIYVVHKILHYIFWIKGRWKRETMRVV